MHPRNLVRSLAALALACAAVTPHAQEAAKGPLTLIVPFAPGSTPDVVGRVVAERLGARLGKTIVVDNRAGAAGNMGTDAVAKAVPDGQTLGVSIAGPLGVNTLLFKRMPYDPARDLDFVTVAVTQASVLVVSAKFPANSPAELMGLMKKSAKYSFASMGAGTLSHLGMEALAARSGAADFVHVPYRGSGAAVTAVISGEVDMALLPAAAVMPHVKAGKIKALAVASARRSPSLAELPTLAEVGVQDVQADAWIGFVLPAKTPPEMVNKLHDELVQILAEPAVREKLRLQYMDPVANTPAEFRRQVADEVARWKPVIQKHNITLD